MKNKGLLLILSISLLCLTIVGCGTKADPKYRILTCSNEEETGKTSIVIKQDRETFELASGVMSLTVDITGYADTAKTMDWNATFCSNLNSVYKDCNVTVTDTNLIVEMEFDMATYTEQLKETKDISGLNVGTLSELKKSAENEGAICKIS